LRGKVRYLDKYSIAFKSLTDGKYEIYFSIDDHFFEHFEMSDVQHGKVKVKVILEKMPRSLHLDIRLKGTLSVQCDRCLDYFDLPVKFKAELNVEFGDETSDITDIYDTMSLSENENELQLAQHFYEYINLSLPIKKVHPDESLCNQEMLKKINEYSVKEKEEHQDSRWDKLKTLYN
jgi:uncharacterized protein